MAAVGGGVAGGGAAGGAVAHVVIGAIQPPAAGLAEGTAAFHAFVAFLSAALWRRADDTGSDGEPDNDLALDTRVIVYMSTVIAGAMGLIEFTGSSGATASDRSIFWVLELAKADVIAVL